MRKVVVIKCLSNEENISGTCTLQSASVKNSGILHASVSYKVKNKKYKQSCSPQLVVQLLSDRSLVFKVRY